MKKEQVQNCVPIIGTSLSFPPLVLALRFEQRCRKQITGKAEELEFLPTRAL